MTRVGLRRRRKWKKKKKRTRTNSPDLPGDIITEILFRLPFDSILTCKLLSKQWKNAVNNPTFYNNYKGLTNSISLFTDTNRILCLHIRHGEKQRTRSGNPRVTLHQLPIACHQTTEFISTHISNGIACVKQDNGAYNLFNLFTGSGSVTVSPALESYNWEYYGFGYDADGDDYKIVQFCHHKTQFLVYSLKNQEWKSFNGFPYSAYTQDPSDWKRCTGGATTVNGVLHWLAPVKRVIITYDLRTGVFGEIVRPGIWYCGLDDTDGVGLHDLNGKLCYTYRKRFVASCAVFDVWRMVGDDWEVFSKVHFLMMHYDMIVRGGRRTPMIHESADGRRLMLFMNGDFTVFWYNFGNCRSETYKESKLFTRGKRKRSCVVEN